MQLKCNVIFFIVLISFIGCSQKQVVIDYTNQNIKYSGRIDTSKNSADLYWPGSSIKMNFIGTGLSALLKDDKGENYYNVIVDDKGLFVFKADTIKQLYTLIDSLEQGAHTVEIFKRTEWNRGKTSFYNFTLLGDGELLNKPETKTRAIEFYGNSITAGYAIEDYSGKDSPDSTYTNNYLSYAALTARHFNAEYSCIVRHGIGITVGWAKPLMPEIYNRIIPWDTTSIWDFSRFTPQIVVVNLLQNDKGVLGTPNHENYIERFGKTAPTNEFIIDAYKDFITQIQYKYPSAKIICALGNMDASASELWVNNVKTAVAELNNSNIYALIFPYKETPGHPRIEEQMAMANQLIDFINKNIEW